MSADRLTYANVAATFALIIALAALVMFGVYVSDNRNDSDSNHIVSVGEIGDDVVDSKSVANGSLQLEDLNVTQLRSLITELASKQPGTDGKSGINGGDGSSIVGPQGNTGNVGQRGPRGLSSTVAVTRLPYDTQTRRQMTVADGGRFVKVLSIGSFRKQYATTALDLTLTTHGRATTPSSTCQWQVRIDDQTSNGNQADGAEAITSSAAAVPMTINNQFDDIALGRHTASLWLKSSAGSGCEDNPGKYLRVLRIEERRVDG